MNYNYLRMHFRLPSILLISVLMIHMHSAQGQVANDACQTATDLGPSIDFWSSVNCLFEPVGGESGTWPFTDSTDLAVAEFPYPSMPLSCEGYALNVTVPSKDMWYRFSPSSEYEIQVSAIDAWASDTLHISVWHGPDCSQLVPSYCLTIPANTSLAITLGHVGGYFHYLQVAGPSLSAASRFSICVRELGPASSPTPFTYGEPTPVLCFPYSVYIQNPPDHLSTGSVQLELDGSYGPFTINWSDGSSDGLSHSFPVGDHLVSVTDANGCMQVIELTIAVDPAQSIDQVLQENMHLVSTVDGRLHILGLSDDQFEQVEIFDMRGALLMTQRINGAQDIFIGSITPGPYIARLSLPGQKVINVQFILVQ